MNVPFLDLKAQHKALRDEILPLWEEALLGAGFIGGPHVQALETEFADACDCRHAIAVSSGTDALLFIFKALGLEPGDEVITAANTFIATSEAITHAGGTPVFVDVEPDTYTIDPEAVAAAIGPNTKGIVPVHLYGQTADMDPILDLAEDRGLWVVEDAAQAHLAEYKGRKAGSMGAAAAFSFYPGKNMGACGDAGAITTDDDSLADNVRLLRDHGRIDKYLHGIEGFNGRCDALQAAALRVKLRHLPEWNAARRAAANKYIKRLSGVDGVVVPTVRAESLPVWHLFVVLVDNRDRVQARLGEAGVATGLHYPVPLHLQPAYRHLRYQEGEFPVSEECGNRLLSLPMFPELTDEQIDYVCDALVQAVSA